MRPRSHALQYLLFSLIAAFFLLCRVRGAAGADRQPVAFGTAHGGSDSVPVFVLLAIGLLIKAGVAGVHVWLPGAYAESDDDLSALLSAVISKVAIFGCWSEPMSRSAQRCSLNLAHVLGWIGMLTTWPAP